MTRQKTSSDSPPASTTKLPDEVRSWIRAGKTDFPLWCRNGFGVELHSAQIEAANAILAGEAAYFVLSWANRAGKTTLLMLLHLHALFYKRGMAAPTTQKELAAWGREGYRTLHTAPLNELAGKALSEAQELLKGTSKSQRDENGVRRPAPLAGFFVAGRERAEDGADRMSMRCTIHNAVCDFRSTEGKAARLEGSPWWFITWDEWPQTENTDDIRYVLYNRLTNRAADYDASIVLTGTITPETEHIAKEFLAKAEDRSDPDWWANHASRHLNPSTSGKALARAERNLDPEDYARAVLGIPGGMKGRVFPSFLIDPIFRTDMPRFTPPDRNIPPQYSYLVTWDLALSEADNAGFVLRVPEDWKFSVTKPIYGCEMKIIPGSRTLTDEELIYAIESMSLAFHGRTVVDATDAHGKNIYRQLRRNGIHVDGWVANERDRRGVTRKEEAIRNTRAIMSEGMVFLRDKTNEVMLDSEGVPRFDQKQEYGALRLPATWTMVKDQLSVLREDDGKQRKDAAMSMIQGLDTLFRIRRAKTHQDRPARLVMFAARPDLSAV